MLPQEYYLTTDLKCLLHVGYATRYKVKLLLIDWYLFALYQIRLQCLEFNFNRIENYSLAIARHPQTIWVYSISEFFLYLPLWNSNGISMETLSVKNVGLKKVKQKKSTEN